MPGPSELAREEEWAERAGIPEEPRLPTPTEAALRKGRPVCTGVLDYFPDALQAVAEVSRIGNEQHNPGQPLHWDKSKSKDEADALVRHLLERGTRDTDGTRHSAKVAWRALALLQREIDAERAEPMDPAVQPAKDDALRITVRLPVRDANGDVYDMDEAPLSSIKVRDVAHGKALVHDLATTRYRSREVTLWQGEELVFAERHIRTPAQDGAEPLWVESVDGPRCQPD